MRTAVAAALQSLGLTMPTTDAASSTSTAASSSSSSSTTAADGSVSSASGSVRQDLQQFMHQLFEAVKSDGGSATAVGGSAGGADAQSSFASGLSTLIGQVANGTAPASLQSAFATLTSALQQTGSASSSSGTGTGTGSSSTTDQASLQSFLTTLQQDLGYGAASSPIGSLLTTQV